MRPNTKIKKHVITTRDLKMLEFIIESKLASRDQLNMMFFKNSNCVRVINRRLNKLLQRNLITRIGVQINDRFLYCYRITEDGLNAVQSNLRLGLLKTPERSEKPHHDLTLVDIRNKFSTFTEVIDYLTENALQSFDICILDSYLLEFKQYNSDAAIQVKINNKIFWLALEFENTLQSFDKLEKKVANIYNSNINAVLLVCKNSSMQEAFQRIEKMHIKSTATLPKIYYQQLNVLLEASQGISFKNILGQFLNIK